MTEDQGRGRRNFRGRGRMRQIARNARPEQSQDRGGEPRPRDGWQRAGGRGPQPRRDRGAYEAVTHRRVRDDRIFSALAHAGFFLGIWGLVTTGAIWALRKERSRSVRFQGAQALGFQALALLVILGLSAWCAWEFSTQDQPPGAAELLGQLHAGGIAASFFGPLSAATSVVVLGAVRVFLGFFAFLCLGLCVLGLEPSYPVLGFAARKILAIEPPSRPDAEPKKATEPPASEKPVSKPETPAPSA